MIEELKKSIEEAEYIIVGIGDKFGYDWHKLDSDERYNELFEAISKDESLHWINPFLQKVAMDANPDMNLKEAYGRIASLCENKNVYFVTTTIDDYIYDSGIPFERIVAPCGGFRFLQCENACTEELIKIPFALLQYVQKLYNKEIDLAEIRDKYPECPHCRANLVLNQIGTENYVEAGYMLQWTKYKTWLESSMNRKTLMIELGAGLGFMSVIRSPFEKMAGYNRKSKLFRVHPTLSMGTPQTEDRCISIDKDPIEWILDLN